jgi:hypothetical protein
MRQTVASRRVLSEQVRYRIEGAREKAGDAKTRKEDMGKNSERLRLLEASG